MRETEEVAAVAAGPAFSFLGVSSPMRAAVVACLEGPELLNLAFVCRDWRRASCNDQALARLETVCFHTKLSAEDAVLGRRRSVGFDPVLLRGGTNMTKL